jgi:hypothetical protein
VTSSLIFATEELAESAKTAALSVTKAPIGKGGKNWVTETRPGNTGELPAYIQNIRNAIMRHQPDESRATAIAIGVVQNWASGRGGVKAEVKAAAAKALAEWEALRAKNAARKGAKDAVREAVTAGCTVPGVDSDLGLFEDADTSKLGIRQSRFRDGKFTAALRKRVAAKGKPFQSMMEDLQAQGHVRNVPRGGTPAVSVGTSPDAGGAGGWMFGSMPDTFASSLAWGGLGEELEEDEMDWDAVALEAERAAEAPVEEPLTEHAVFEAALLQERTIHQSKREELLKKGQAIKNADGSIVYPIENAKDLQNAATLARSGHGDVPKAKRLIAKMSKKLGVKNPLEEGEWSHLPKEKRPTSELLSRAAKISPHKGDPEMVEKDRRMFGRAMLGDEHITDKMRRAAHAHAIRTRQVPALRKKLGGKLEEASVVCEPDVKKGDRVRVRSDVHLASVSLLKGREGVVEEAKDVPMGGNGATMRRLSVKFPNDQRHEINASHVEHVAAKAVQKVEEAGKSRVNAPFSITHRGKKLTGMAHAMGWTPSAQTKAHLNTLDRGRRTRVEMRMKRAAEAAHAHASSLREDDVLAELDELLEGDGPRDYGQDAWSGAIPRVRSLNQGEVMRFPDGSAIKRHASPDGRDQFSAGTPAMWKDDGISWRDPKRTPEEAVRGAMEASAASTDPESLGGNQSFYRGMVVMANGNGLRFAGVNPQTGNPLVSHPGSPTYRPQEVDWSALAPNVQTVALRS